LFYLRFVYYKHRRIGKEGSEDRNKNEKKSKMKKR